MSTGNKFDDPEDMFADTRMSFGDHIEDLRMHLWRAVIGFVIIVSLVLILDGIGWLTDTDIGIGVPVMKFMAKPVEDALVRFYDERVKKVMAKLEPTKREPVKFNQPTNFTQFTFLRQDLQGLVNGAPVQEEDSRTPITQEGLDALIANEDIDKNKAAEYYRVVTDNDMLKVWTRVEQPVQLEGLLHKARSQVGRRPVLSTLGVTEAMMVYFKVAIVCGIVLGSPWIFWQLWAFIAAGLYPHEKRYVNVYLPFSLGLFLAGVAVCELLVLPRAVDALLWFNEWLDLEPDLRLNEWLGFAIMMPLVFGVAFQTPLVMLFLERIGIMNIDSYRGKRKLAWFVMAVFAAVITPTPDAFTLILMWVPMCGLYELGILMCKLSPRAGGLDVDVPESEEMIEV